jgi:hypothetical protein
MNANSRRGGWDILHRTPSTMRNEILRIGQAHLASAKANRDVEDAGWVATICRRWQGLSLGLL